MICDLLFVYGLLRRKANHEMGEFLRESADFISEGTFQGKLYQIDYYPGVIASDDPLDIVYGDLYRVSGSSLLSKLDQFEGVGPEFPSPNEYIRQVVEAALQDKGKVKAWIYLYNRPLDKTTQIISGDFLRP